MQSCWNTSLLEIRVSSSTRSQLKLQVAGSNQFNKRWWKLGFIITTAELLQIRTAVMSSRRFKYQEGNCITSWIQGSPNKSKTFNINLCSSVESVLHPTDHVYFCAYGSILFHYVRSPERYLYRHLSNYITNCIG